MNELKRNGDSLFESLDDSTVPSSIPASVPPSSTAAVGNSDDEDRDATITLRALVSSKEAGVIIGKGGKNVADMREETQVRAGVSKPVPGVPDRVLTITGTVNGVARAYAMAAETLVESPPPPATLIHSLSPPPPPGIATIRLLISHQQMGTVIGRQGQKIRAIQESSKVRMVASKEMLPQSTERIVEIQGIPSAVKNAVHEVAKCLLADWDRSAGSIPYSPQPFKGGLRSVSMTSSGPAPRHMDATGSGPGRTSTTTPAEEAYREIEVPSALVGCVIGKAGSKIQEIRQLSGARISIARYAHDESGNRLFTIRGTPEANQKALDLLYDQIEQERVRRNLEEPPRI
uniref:ARAD1B19712p n=1 Tax=Blastobotrys adeninivorans TaxID=409370 RepID=A0A060T729_BLAAD